MTSIRFPRIGACYETLPSPRCVCHSRYLCCTGEIGEKVTGDSGFFSGAALHAMKRRGVDVYVPDNNLRHEMQSGERAQGIGRCTIRDPEHLELREKLRSPQGRRMYQRRQAVVEPVFGILKDQRGMRKFKRRGLAAVTTEWMLAAMAYNLTRMARQ